MRPSIGQGLTPHNIFLAFVENSLNFLEIMTQLPLSFFLIWRLDLDAYSTFSSSSSCSSLQEFSKLLSIGSIELFFTAVSGIDGSYSDVFIKIDIIIF